MKKGIIFLIILFFVPTILISQGYLRNDNLTNHTSGITINEISARSATVDFNADGTVSTTSDQDEYIEIVNSSSEAIDISGWILGDNNTNFTIPSGTILGPGNAVVIFTQNADVSNFDPGPGNYVFSAPSSFALANSNDAVGLKNTYGLYIEVYWGSGTLNSAFTSGATLVGSRVQLSIWQTGQSQTRNPDYIGEWIQHPEISGTVNWSKNNPTITLTNPKGSPGRFNYGDVPLPVQVTKVSAEVIGNVVKLRIKTQVESSEFLGFEIYRSIDNVNYVLAGSYLNNSGLKSKGGEMFGGEYEFVDKEITGSGKVYYRIEAVSKNERRLIDVVEVEIEVPKNYVLHQNYPNPFNPATTIEFEIPVGGNVVLELYNSAGQKVMDIFSGELPAGYHKIRFDGSNLASGVYFYVLRVNGFVGVKKMVLVK